MADLHPILPYDGTIPKQETAVLVVDMQRAFFSDTDSLGKSGIDVSPLRAAIPGCVRLVNLARASGVPVIFTRYVYMPGMVDFGAPHGVAPAARRASNSLGYGTDEIELIPELGVRPDEVVIDKSRPSAFYGTRLEPVLTGMGARDAGQRDYGTFVVSDAVAEFLPERNHYALFGLAWMFGFVVDLAAIERNWAAVPARQAG